MNDKENYGEKERPYEPVSHQLSNRELLDNDQRESDSSKWLFPKEVDLDGRKRIVNPLQFIVAGKGPDIDKLLVGKEFWLEPNDSDSSNRIRVRVIKSRKSAPHGKRYVLLQASSSITKLEGQEVGIFEGEASPQSIGVIHTGGEANEGGGKGHSGQTNCYGVALLVKLRAGRTPDPASEIEMADQIATFETDAELGTATIAVLDSGIQFTGSSNRSTIPSDVGWDFVSDSTTDGDPFPNDDHLGLHGTKICTIIKHTAPGAGILPVKVSNRNGSLNLYDALCGLEYARTHGAKVVNASWSFTATGNHDPATDYPLLLQAIRDLEDSGIVVVAAAGNRNQYLPEADGHIGKRSAPKIYPACYSGIQCNVITVTTVTHGGDGKYSAFENYSPQFVDTGALANAVSRVSSGRFTIPGFIDNYQGSSFATPYVAAKIARLIGALTGCLSKRAILHRLDQFHQEDDLAYAIRDGGSYITV